MSYEPTEWKKGDVVTSQKLNKLEQGVAGAGGVLVVGATISEGIITLNKTAGEIIEASKAGLVLLPTNFSGDAVASYYLSFVDDHDDGSEYDIWFVTLGDRSVNIQYSCFHAMTKNDYPTMAMPGSGGEP